MIDLLLGLLAAGSSRPVRVGMGVNGLIYAIYHLLQVEPEIAPAL